MILKSVFLENIRSYISEKIEFSEGSTLLSGDIGSGKSTILLAIEFALFGIQRGDFSGASLLRHGKAKGSVELDFLIEGKSVMIKRSLKRSKDTIAQDTGYIIIDGRKTEGTPVELKAKILSILGYPDDILSKSKSMIFRYTVYTPQEEMKQILLEDKETRLTTLRKLFGIDKYKQVRDNALFYGRELRALAIEKSAKTENLDSLIKQKNEHEEKAKILSERIIVENKALLDIKELVKSAKNEEKLLRKKQEEYNEQKSRLDVLRARLKEKKEALVKLKKDFALVASEISIILEKLETYALIERVIFEEPIQKELDLQEKQFNETKSIRAIFSERLSFIEKSTDEVNKEIIKEAEEAKHVISKGAMIDELKEKLSVKPKLEQELLDEVKKQEVLRQKLTEKKVMLGSIEKSILELNSLGLCPKCRQKVPDSHKIAFRESKKTESDELKALIAKLEKMEESLIKKNEVLKLSLDSFKKHEDALIRLNSDIIHSRKSAEKLVLLQKKALKA
ncbi:MAG: SMC family ATPase [archaeon]